MSGDLVVSTTSPCKVPSNLLLPNKFPFPTHSHAFRARLHPTGFWLVGMEVMLMDVQQAPSCHPKSRFSAPFADTGVEAMMPPLRPQSVSGIRARMLSLIDSPLPRL